MTIDILCCEVAGRTYAIRGRDARTIARADALVVGPGPDDRIGTVSHDGTTVPVCEVADRLGVSRDANAHRQGHIVVTGTGPDAQGWLVDRIARRAAVEEHDVIALPAVVGPESHRLFDGLLTVDEHSMLVLRTDDGDGAERTESSEQRVGAQPARSMTGARRQNDVPLLIVFSTPALSLPAGARAALSVKQVCEVLAANTIAAVPRAPRSILGVLAWRGQAVPVIDLVGDRVGIADLRLPRVLIAQERRGVAEPIVIAIPIDDDAGIQKVVSGGVRIVNGGGEPVHGVFRLGDELMALVDIAAVVRTAAESTDVRAVA
jgi:chemotaxis signal transduction protein